MPSSAPCSVSSSLSRPVPRHWSLRLQRIEPVRNRRRHWSIAREPTLFHPDGALVRRWGRIGTWTRTGIPVPLAPEPAVRTARRLVRAKLRRGYAVTFCSWPELLAEADDAWKPRSD